MNNQVQHLSINIIQPRPLRYEELCVAKCVHENCDCRIYPKSSLNQNGNKSIQIHEILLKEEDPPDTGKLDNKTPKATFWSKLEKKRLTHCKTGLGPIRDSCRTRTETEKKEERRHSAKNTQSESQFICLLGTKQAENQTHFNF